MLEYKQWSNEFNKLVEMLATTKGGDDFAAICGSEVIHV
jgi:hypothetical protein